ncbi:MAG: sigma-70 family RNA polymerase sigma factor [Planctomycetota bacterium]|nr:sigma-70 family RNA polymerase sigma factor [Planctomycetota bacterium]
MAPYLRPALTETLRPSSRAPEEPPSTPDGEDLQAAALGDGDAFGRLVGRHQQAVMNAAFYYSGDREDALEVSQEAFVKAYRALKGFRGEASFRTWILRITVNTARSFTARKRAKKRSASLVSLSSGGENAGSGVEVADPGDSPAALLERKEVKEAIEEAIAGLEPEARELIVLRDISGRPYDEISEVLALPIGTVKSKVHRARLELRRKLERYL